MEKISSNTASEESIHRRLAHRHRNDPDRRSQSSSQTSVWTVTFSYSYFVDEYRSGEFELPEFSSEDEADDFARLLKGKQVLAHYNPRNPDKSILDNASLQDTLSKAIQDDKSATSPEVHSLAFDRADYVQR